MRVGMLGTGNLAVALGRAWTSAGHTIVVTGRNPDRAARAADLVGAGARTVEPARLAHESDAVVLTVAWDGLREAVELVGGPDGALSGHTVLDCTNAVDFATGALLPTGSAAQLVADAAPGARVIKALHLFAGASWPFVGTASESPVVALCGEHADALESAGRLVRDLGARPVVVGGLDAARQAEEVAGFVMRVVAAGANPRYAVPDVAPAASDG